MEFIEFKIIPMTKESKWEDDNTPLENFKYTEDFEEWYKAYNERDLGDWSDRVKLKKDVLEFIHSKRKNKAYMLGPTASYNGQALVAKTRRFFVEEIIPFVENNDIFLYEIASTKGGINFALNDVNFEQMDELVLRPQTIYIRYEQING